jgi:hypothetical protein
VGIRCADHATPSIRKIGWYSITKCIFSRRRGSVSCYDILASASRCNCEAQYPLIKFPDPVVNSFASALTYPWYCFYPRRFVTELEFPLKFCKYLTFNGFEVLTVVAAKSSVFWDITPWNPLQANQRFGGTCRLDLRGLRISQARKLATCFMLA